MRGIAVMIEIQCILAETNWVFLICQKQKATFRFGLVFYQFIHYFDFENEPLVFSFTHFGTSLGAFSEAGKKH